MKIWIFSLLCRTSCSAPFFIINRQFLVVTTEIGFLALGLWNKKSLVCYVLPICTHCVRKYLPIIIPTWSTQGKIATPSHLAVSLLLCI